MTAPQPLRVIRHTVTPEEIGTAFLKREMYKLYPTESEAFDQLISRQIDSLPEQLGQEEFWKLIAGVAEGYMLKGIYRLLTDTTFTWRLEEIQLDDITMTGMSGQLDELLAEADWTPSRFAQVWAKQSKVFRDKVRLEPHRRRDDQPIVAYEAKGTLQVMDGMRRTCVAALQSRPSIQAYVGRIENPSGRSMISPDKVMYTMLLYDDAEEKPPGLLEAVKTVLIAYKKNYRNGPAVVDEMVSPWLDDPQYRDVAEKIMQA